MSKAIIRTALIQHCDHGDVGNNLDYIAGEIGAAAAQGARLVLLQELHNHAYFCQTEDAGHFDLAEPIPGPTTSELSRLARHHGLVVVGSVFERRATGLYHNTAVVLEADGSLAGRYRKMHIPQDPGYQEKFYFTPGDQGFHPIATSVGRLGVMVCWDQWFPEAARLMALAGADMLLYPTAIGWDARDGAAERVRQQEAWLTVQRGHAIANGIPLMCCNRSGFEAAPRPDDLGIHFWGHSFACGPQGELLGSAGPNPETLIVDIDTGRAEHVRRIWPFLRDRRIDAYQQLVERLLD